MKKNTLYSCASVFAMLLGSNQAAAQEQGETASDGSGLNVIVVTATKREQSVLDTALAIDAISGEEARKFATSDLAALSESTPNVFIGNGLGEVLSINIRGVGSGNDAGFEQSVGFFIDGVYMPRRQSYRSPFFDIERVEFLRGPQAVLFGLNSTAGAVSVITQKNRPGDPLSGYVNGEYNVSRGGAVIEGAVGGSLSDSVAVRVAGRYGDKNGYMRNVASGRRTGNDEEIIARFSAVFEPSDNFNAELKYEFNKSQREGLTAEVFAELTPGYTGADDQTLNFNTTNTGGLQDELQTFLGVNEQLGYEQKVHNVALETNVNIGDHVWTTVGGFSTFTDDTFSDTDAVAADVLGQRSSGSFELFSVESRIASSGDPGLNYIAGLYYQTSNLVRESNSVVGRAALFGVPLSPQYIRTRQETDEKSFSLFADVSYDITDQLKIGAGVRWVQNKKTALRNGVQGFLADPFDPTDNGTVLRTGPYTGTSPFAAFENIAPFNIGIPDGTVGRRKTNNVMPEIRIEYHGDNNLLYAKYGESAKAGGFAGSIVVLESNWRFNDEQARGFEVGYKQQIGNYAQFTLSAFHTKFSDLQLNAFDAAGIPLITNAGTAVSKGLEFSGQWAVNDWLTLSGALSYLDAKFTDYPEGPCNTSETAAPGANGCLRTGFNLPQSSKWSGNAGFDVEAPVTDGINFLANASMNFRSSYTTEGTLDPLARQGGYATIDARIGIASADDNGWELAMIGRNLTKRVILTGTQPFLGAFFGYLREPRTFLLNASYKF